MLLWILHKTYILLNINVHNYLQFFLFLLLFISSLTIFRSLRLLRVFKLARSWKGLAELIKTVMKSASGLFNFGLLLSLFIFAYALIGMELYGGNFTPENGFEEAPRFHFDSFVWSLVTVFQVISGENWNETMYIGMRFNGVVGSIYFVSLFVLGNFVALNLFLAILLQNFGDDDDDEDDDEEDLLVNLFIFSCRHMFLCSLATVLCIANFRFVIGFDRFVCVCVCVCVPNGLCIVFR